MNKKGGAFENFEEIISQQDPDIVALTKIIGSEPSGEIQLSMLAYTAIIAGPEFSSAVHDQLRQKGML